jgi:hypothetical protein
MEREFLEGLRMGEQALSEEIVEQILAQHTQELAQVRLQSSLETAVAKTGGRNIKAISALLDMDAVAQSEDVPAALSEALAQLKKDSPYLFESPAPPAYAKFTGTARDGSEHLPQTLAGALRERMKRN